MKYNKVQSNFWISNKVIRWDKNTIFIALYILTNQHRSSEGIYRLPKSYVSEDTNFTTQEVEEAFEELIESDFVRYDIETSVIMITKALKYQSINNPNHQKAALKILKALPTSYLLIDFLEQADKYCRLFKEFLLEFLEDELLSEAQNKKDNIFKSEDNGLSDGINNAITDPPSLTPALTTQTQKQKLSQERCQKKFLANSNTEIDENDRFYDVKLKSNDHLYKKNQKSQALELTKYLIEKIKDNNHRARVPEIDLNNDLFIKWIKEMEKLNNIGPVGAKKDDNKGYSWQEIKKIIDFSQDDEFWSSNILSAKKLRKQVIKLENQMNKSGKSESTKRMDMLAELYVEYLNEEQNDDEE
ncbi:hypothetical protein [Halanaerobium hydrogeniformans]|uniref:Primosome, DnaD subunit n=1 Tax=Halanaerobium hydrogeniformans TaxID=656519 RepID=E4RNN4_HALHG|nr:hypothetical protein [Halanaerobium hydrogeniformans]ADQ13712.1 hypothetical protein Halsa_0228 [Halanaerobium hydrogeniformans]